MSRSRLSSALLDGDVDYLSSHNVETITHPCSIHGDVEHAKSSSPSSAPVCLLCTRAEIEQTDGNKAQPQPIPPSVLSISSIVRSSRRYSYLRKTETPPPDLASMPGTTNQQRRAVYLVRKCGSQAEAARKMKITRAAVNALLKRAGEI